MIKTNQNGNESDDKKSSDSDLTTISSKRSQLYRNIAHLISKQSAELNSKPGTKGKRSTDGKPSVLLDVLDAFKGDVQETARVELATEIATLKTPPLDLAEKLAMDTLRVATPILKTITFDDETLLRIINATDRQHHILIAERGNLSKDLWKAIARNRMKNVIGNKKVVVKRDQVQSSIQDEIDKQEIQAEKEASLLKLAKQVHDEEAPSSTKPSSTEHLSDWDAPFESTREEEKAKPNVSIMENPFDDGQINDDPFTKRMPYHADHQEDIDPFIHDKEIENSPTSKFNNPINTHPGRKETAPPLHTMIREMDSTASLVDAILEEGHDTPPSNKSTNETASHPMDRMEIEDHNEDPYKRNVDHADSWSFVTDRFGNIDNISANAAKAFGFQPFELRGENLFETLIIDPQGDGIRSFDDLITKHHPLRDIRFKLLSPQGQKSNQASQWLMRAKARFDPLNGRFTGYEGTAFPLILPEDLSENKSGGTGDFENAESISGAVATKIISSLAKKSIKPAHTLIATAVKLAQMAQTKSDRALLHDALNVLEATKELKEMIEDSDSLLMTLQGRQQFDSGKFTLGNALKEILDLDSTKEGTAARFYLDPAAMSTTIKFNHVLFTRVITRMINVARMFGSRQGDRIITAQPGLSGLLEIRVPLGTGTPPWEISDILFDPIEALQGKIDQTSPAQSAYHTAFGLSALQKPIQSLGGKISLISGQDESHWLMLEVKTLL